MVPRDCDEWVSNIDVEDLARIAVAQAFRDSLFDTHPGEAVELDAIGLRWDGDLAAGQWLHGASASQTPDGAA
jgi:hypothetical protein